MPVDIRETLENIRARHDLPALAAALVEGGSVTGSGAVGVRARGSAEAATVADRWHLGSCTKAMTATLAALLVEDGVLAWDTTVGDGLVALRGDISPAWQGVTLEQLLAHRSGLPDDRVPVPGEFERVRALAGPIDAQRLALARLVLAAQPSAAPGTETRYSNCGYVVAAVMAEQATGKSWERLLAERVLEPLGMRSAGFGPPGTPGVVDEPRGHDDDGPVEPGPLADNPAVLGPAGNVHCNLRDWARFAALHLEGARGESDLLGEAAFAKLHAALGEDGDALGWLVDPADRDGPALFHSGSNGMWMALAWLSPARGRACLVAMNAGGDAAGAACRDTVGALVT